MGLQIQPVARASLGADGDITITIFIQTFVSIIPSPGLYSGQCCLLSLNSVETPIPPPVHYTTEENLENVGYRFVDFDQPRPFFLHNLCLEIVLKEWRASMRQPVLVVRTRTHAARVEKILTASNHTQIIERIAVGSM